MGGRFERGIEITLQDGVIDEVRLLQGPEAPFVLSPAFVNAHSHLEYRGLMGVIREREFWPWIREITRLKATQALETVATDAALAAWENRRTGVALIGEHSDRPVAGEALARAGIGGRIFEEVITFFERGSPEQKLRKVREQAELNRTCFSGSVHLSPHALYSVDEGTLRLLAFAGDPISVHLAESPDETRFFREGEGPIADFCRAHDVPFDVRGESAFEKAERLGLVRTSSQLVHCCDLTEDEAERLALSGASVAHCPRSNRALGCPAAPIRELLDAGATVGLGLDSCASAGPIDMFAEMRAAIALAQERGRPLAAEEAWLSATAGGAKSLGCESWDLVPGASVPLIKLHIPDAESVADLIARGSPEVVEWVER